MTHLAGNPLEVGGNGDPVRTATYEESNAISLLGYYNLVHLQDLGEKIRNLTSIIRNSYSLFVEGSITKACETWLERWRLALEYGIECPWHDTILKGSDLLRRRVGQQDLWGPMTEFIEMTVDSELERDCKGRIGQWIGVIMKIVNKMGNDNPGAVDNAIAKQQLASMNALVAVSTPSQPSSQNKGHTGRGSWTCGAAGCNSFIPDDVKVAHQKKKGDQRKIHPNSVENPDTILCTEHHDKFVAGTDIKLKSGDNKWRPGDAQQSGQQNQTAEQKLKAFEKKEEEKQRKKRVKNQARRARVKAKKADASAAESAQKSEQQSEQKKATTSDTSSLNELMGAITLLQGAGLVVKGADASPVIETPIEAEQAEAKQVKIDSSDPMIKLAMSLTQAAAK